MKRLFIPAKALVKISIPKKYLILLDKAGRIGLVTTIQHLHEMDAVAGRIKGSKIIGQVLGCNSRVAESYKDKVDAYLFIGSGRFHPINLKVRTDKKVFTFDPFTKELRELTDKDTTLARRKLKAGTVALLTKQKVGILVTTKEGQERIKDAERLKTLLRQKGKEAYILVSETLDPNLLEGFPSIECYVNSACPRIIEDDLPRPVINIDDAFTILCDAS